MTASTDMKAGHRLARGMVLMAALALLGFALQALTGGPVVQVATLRGSTGIGADPVDAVIAALSLGSQAMVFYLLLMVALATVGTLPGLVGRAAGTVLRQVSPVSLRRALEGLVGGALMVGVAFGPVQPSAFAAPAAPVSGPVGAGVAGAVAGGHTGSATPVDETPSPGATPVAPATTVEGIPAPDQTPSEHERSEQEPATAVTSPVVAAAVAAAAAPAVTAADTPARAVTTADNAVSPDPAPAAEPVTDAEPDHVTHTVEPGDTLWDIAARHLPDDRRNNETIAAYWQQIYAANLQTVGEDPDLIHPGAQLLVPPPPDQRI